MSNIFFNIKEQLNTLSYVNRKIALYVLNNPEEVVFLSIADFSKKIDISEASITRFCKKLDTSGFKEFKIIISQNINNLGANITFNVDSKDFKDNIQKNLLNQYIEALKKTEHLINADFIINAAKLIFNAESILCVGIGASELVARDMIHKFYRTQKNAFFTSDIDSQKLILSRFTQKDLLIAISYSGKKKEIVDIASQAHIQNVPIIAITKFGKTPLGDISTVKIEGFALEDEYRESALSSRIVHLYLIDVLFYTYGLYFKSDIFETLRKTYNIVR